MLVNPLFDQTEDDEHKKPKQDEGYLLKNRKARTIQPINKDLKAPSHTAATHSGHEGRVVNPENPAVELIRRKVDALYAGEPDIKEELEEAAQPAPQLSKHQQFMHSLSTSGKSLAQIQTEWHNYYVHLPDAEKHEVWREFYQANSRQPSAYTSYVTQQAQATQSQQTHHEQPRRQGLSLPGAIAVNEPKGTSAFSHKPKAMIGEHLPSPNYAAKREHRTRSQIKKQIVDKLGISEAQQKKAKQHFQSLLFGLGMGALVLVIFLFGFFNEVIIAPFIQPSRHVSATPIIVGTDSVATSDKPEVIIPKINVQIPTVFDEPSNDEAAIENALERGVVHYPSTVLPGQKGNAAFFGHSSNNIFNNGQYKFAFVLLHELVPGDIFYLTYNKTTYTYRVYDKKVVAPSEVSVLNSVPDKVATATLITCDPPGTSNNRLVVWGEQISPDPAGNGASTAQPTATSTPTELASNGPNMWSKFWNWLFH